MIMKVPRGPSAVPWGDLHFGQVSPRSSGGGASCAPSTPLLCASQRVPSAAKETLMAQQKQHTKL